MISGYQQRYLLLESVKLAKYAMSLYLILASKVLDQKEPGIFYEISIENGQRYLPAFNNESGYLQRMCYWVQKFQLPTYLLQFLDEPSNHSQNSSPRIILLNTLQTDIQCIKLEVVVGLDKDSTIYDGTRVIKGFLCLDVDVEFGILGF